MGLNKPLWLQFGLYLGRVLQGDLGRSMITNRPVIEELASTIGPTVELMLACLVWAVPIGITLGTLAARKRGTWIDRLIMAVSVAGVSMPVFFIGLLLIQYVGGAGLLPFHGPRRADLDLRTACATSCCRHSRSASSSSARWRA